ncbi:hypothetical protein [Pseudooceanicola algae]|uniref:Uncharacterized protein n=1 Tax=Pseudooceanicola algae TaxID=1537215 RepID=A0A418SGY9_9RHOB|nr:hypothetical protein PSAL_030460 [Pseudooceanicola algae]
MTDTTLIKTRLAGGTWQGLLTARGRRTPPALDVRVDDRVVEGVELTAPEAGPGVDVANSWLVTVPIPAAAIADGVRVFVIQEQESGRLLNSFAIVAGEALQDRLIAEVELLRAELDMLKRAFRNHCATTSGQAGQAHDDRGPLEDPQDGPWRDEGWEEDPWQVDPGPEET